jgi:2-oxoglutarate dehydrogenase E1 component
MDDRRLMAAGELPMDWGFAETLAYASLVDSSSKLRLVGQDSGRGTFFHRHAVLHNQRDGATYIPLQHINPDKGVWIVDSLLSEEAVLGFEYGYATAAPETLNIWEAQFGDFVNGAQVVIDQFLASGETKWGRLCGLVLFLPHGYEGQGPEHSSARLERFLQLCSFGNLQVCVPSTPAQIFHMLRRQMLQDTRKPLVVMMPKSLLRNKASTSLLELVETTHFRKVIDDRQISDKAAIQRVVLCSGKVFYDIDEARHQQEGDWPALVRVEQLHPFPEQDLLQVLERYPNAREIVWCQEEPKNQGAWYQIRHHLQECIGDDHRLLYTGRRRSPSPATGYHSVHVAEQESLVRQALTPGEGQEY